MLSLFKHLFLQAGPCPSVFIIIFIIRIFLVFTLSNNNTASKKTSSQLTHVARIVPCLFYIMLYF